MPIPERHASLESVWFWLPRVLLDASLSCSKCGLSSCLVVPDSRNIRRQLPTRTPNSPLLISTHFEQGSRVKTRVKSEALREVKLPLENVFLSALCCSQQQPRPHGRPAGPWCASQPTDVQGCYAAVHRLRARSHGGRAKAPQRRRGPALCSG